MHISFAKASNLPIATNKAKTKPTLNIFLLAIIIFLNQIKITRPNEGGYLALQQPD